MFLYQGVPALIGTPLVFSKEVETETLSNWKVFFIILLGDIFIMKTRLFEIIICLLICSCSHGPAEFHVITTTDLHGALDSTMSSIYSYITNARAEYGDNLIVLDCGDNVQGSPQAYYSDYVDYADSSIFAKVFNELQYDALKGPCPWTSMLHRAFRKMAEKMGYVNDKSVTATIVSPSQPNAVLNKGPLTTKDIISIYPYENTMRIIEMTGSEIKDYLEYAYSLLLDYLNNPIYVFDTVSGLEYTVEASKQASHTGHASQWWPSLQAISIALVHLTKWP